MEHDDIDLWDIFGDIAVINRWLDESNIDLDPEMDSLFRVMKIGEEFGEAVAAYIGFTGQNPRKGRTHTQFDLLAELADVVVTALAAIQHMTQDERVTRAVMASKITAILQRTREPRADMTPLVPVSDLPVNGANPPHVIGACHCGRTHDRTGALAANLVR